MGSKPGVASSRSQVRPVRDVVVVERRQMVRRQEVTGGDVADDHEVGADVVVSGERVVLVGQPGLVVEDGLVGSRRSPRSRAGSRGRCRSRSTPAGSRCAAGPLGVWAPVRAERLGRGWAVVSVVAGDAIGTAGPALVGIGVPAQADSTARPAGQPSGEDQPLGAGTRASTSGSRSRVHCASPRPAAGDAHATHPLPAPLLGPQTRFHECTSCTPGVHRTRSCRQVVASAGARPLGRRNRWFTGASTIESLAPRPRFTRHCQGDATRTDHRPRS